MILTRRISQCIILTNGCQIARNLQIPRHISLSIHKKCDKPLVPYNESLDNNQLETIKEAELQDRLAELPKDDYIQADSMIRLYTKDKNSSELSLTDETYPTGLAASQQASPSGTLTGISNLKKGSSLQFDTFFGFKFEIFSKNV